ncbi:thiol reductant ABC exporter subunit CydD [Paenibacillaceae bacterium]|nr:thiol reductant ABC exporter subunit CydD [Paenibacillaceae bacterium]
MDKAWLRLKGFKPAAMLIALFSLAQGIAIGMQAFGLSRAISVLFSGEPVNQAVMPLLWFIAAVLARQTIVWLQRRTAGRLAEQVTAHWRKKLAERLFERGPGYAAKEGSGKLVTLAIEGMEKFRLYLELTIPRTFDMLCVTLSVLGFVYALDVVSGLILTAVMPILVGFFILFGLAARKQADKQWRSYRVLSHHFTDSLRGLSTLRFLGRGRSHGRTIDQVSNQYRSATMRTLRVAFLSSFALDFFTMLSVASVAVSLGLRLVGGTMGLEAALVVLMLAPEYFLPIRNLGTDYHATLDGKEAWEAIHRVSDNSVANNTDDVAGTAHADATAKSLGQRSGLEQKSGFEKQSDLDAQPGLGKRRFADVALAGIYVSQDDEQRPQLQDISVALDPAARRIGIVGASGAGKSTLLDVIAGFASPASGNVIIAGNRLEGQHREGWQQQFSYIPQHPHLFSLSLADNVRFYEPDASLEQVKEAVKAVGLSELTARLAAGYDEPIGEGGRILSGGQKQRVALARALLGNRPNILLDEPTAHLDIETELELKETILQVTEGKRMFLATHRLHWMPDMDQIWVLDQGALVETGTHEELLSRQGVYYRLYTATGKGMAM